jgi:ketosteroid isomerase-like protein
MSRENVELVRQAFEAFNRDGLPALQEFWDPEIVWHTDPMVPEPGVYEGREAVTAYLEASYGPSVRGAWRCMI